VRSCCSSFSTRSIASSFEPPFPASQARGQSDDRGRYCQDALIHERGIQFKFGRIRIEKINGSFLYSHGGSPAEYGLALAIVRGWLWKHESGTYVKFAPAGADLTA
jgi:hypothetical protein